ncbi:cyclic nucleotide-binding domain-containing protein [Coraliomargarita sp. SDUM461003]|uniref:Cyclic nucleotide-binding domain-containing protein n=1 Tax=Thalassobacterium maritimum TaxID=3041265 RepID=A0ABU1B0H1_9BACT|nr:cyclic nucleotide-binding domain-containing protein [Coraliomargarita sp. SDUM461003]MDQ8209402.1 cyclic nucleotide-binding domain-containing protein [Coraliomargarita sp. SDUM461003]
MRKVLHILGHFNDSDIQWIKDVASLAQFPAGETVIRPNEKLENLYIVTSGQLEVVHPVSGVIATLSDGEILGEMSFLDDRPPDVTVEAVSDVAMVAIPMEEILEYFQEDPSFEGRFFRALALFLSTRLRGTQNRLAFGKAEVVEEKKDGGSGVELDPNTLKSIQRAGGFFDQIRNHFQ